MGKGQLCSERVKEAAVETITEEREKIIGFKERRGGEMGREQYQSGNAKVKWDALEVREVGVEKKQYLAVRSRYCKQYKIWHAYTDNRGTQLKSLLKI